MSSSRQTRATPPHGSSCAGVDRPPTPRPRSHGYMKISRSSGSLNDSWQSNSPPESGAEAPLSSAPSIACSCGNGSASSHTCRAVNHDPPHTRVQGTFVRPLNGFFMMKPRRVLPVVNFEIDGLETNVFVVTKPHDPRPIHWPKRLSELYSPWWQSKAGLDDYQTMHHMPANIFKIIMESGPRNHDRKGPHLGGRVEIYRWHMPKGYRSHCCLGLQAVHPKEPNEKTLDFLAFKLHKTGSTLEVPVLLIDWLREKPLLYFVQPFGDIDSLLQSIKFDGLEINYENAIWAHLTARPGNSHDKVRSVDRERWQGGHRPYLFYLKFGGQKPYARLIITENPEGYSEFLARVERPQRRETR